MEQKFLEGLVASLNNTSVDIILDAIDSIVRDEYDRMSILGTSNESYAASLRVINKMTKLRVVVKNQYYEPKNDDVQEQDHPFGQWEEYDDSAFEDKNDEEDD